MKQMEIFEKNLIPVNGNTPYINKTLERYTQKVHKIGVSIQSNLFEVAKIIAKVDELKCYESDGYSSVHDWSKREFGFASTRSHELLKIGREYVQEIMTEKGKCIGTRTNLTTSERDYTISQVAALLPLGHPVAFELTESEVVSPEMTVKQIKAVVKRYKGDTDDAQDETDDAQDETEDEAPDENAIEDMANAVALLLVTDGEGNEYEVPRDLLEQYRKI